MTPARRNAVFPSPQPALLAALLIVHLAAATLSTQGREGQKPGEQAEERLSWMREHQTGMWNISPREGVYLYNLVVHRHLKRALEIGTSNGYSAIWIASGMRLTGGHLLTFEIDEGRANLARENFRAAGVEAYVTIQQADALQEIPKLKDPFDFVFIDAWKQDYVRYLDMVLPLVPPGGVIVAHNVKDMESQLQDFIQKVKSSSELKTTFADPGPGGFSISVRQAQP